MRNSFVFRSSAAADAKKNNETNFCTVHTPSTGMWKWAHQPGDNLASEWAKGKDFVAWTETTFVDSVKKGLVVVTITREELALEDVPAEFIYEPVTASLWDQDRPDVGTDAAPKTRMTATGPRAKSGIESPVKTVWRLADEMKGQDRKVVIAACIEAGVNKATASTQFYRWQKAQFA